MTSPDTFSNPMPTECPVDIECVTLQCIKGTLQTQIVVLANHLVITVA